MGFSEKKLGAIVSLLAVISFVSVPNLPMVSASQVLAQTADARTAEADRLFNQGIKQYETSQFTAALQSWEQALKIYREIQDRRREGNALNNLGVAYLSLGDYPKAVDYHKQRLKIAREIKDRQGEGFALDNLGYAYSSLYDYPKAIDYYQQRLKIARELKDRRSEAKSLRNIGSAYFFLANYPKAIEFHQQRLKIAREIKDAQDESNSLLNLGYVYYSLGDYPKAMDYHQKSLKIAREIKYRRGEGHSLNHLGLVYRQLGDYPKAIEFHQQSLKIAREIKDRNEEGKVLGNLGNVYNALGDYPKAIDYQKKWLAIARETKDRNDEGKALLNLGNAYSSLEDYSKAIDYHQQRLKIVQETKDIRGESDALNQLGLAYLYLGDYSKAMDYTQQSLKIAQETKYRRNEGGALNNLGLAYYYLGDYSKAIDYHQQSLKIAQEIKDNYSQGTALGNIGNVYNALGDYSKAIDYQKEWLKIAREIKYGRGKGAALGSIGNAYYSLGDYRKAIEYHQQSLKIKREIQDRRGEGNSLSNIGLAYSSLGDYPKAIEYLQQGLKIHQDIKYRHGEGASLNNLGSIYYKQGNLTLAETTITEGIKVYESMRGRELKDSEKISFFDTQRNIYRTLQQVLIAQNKTDVALEISERGRVRAFVELLASRLSPNPQEQSPKPPNIEEIKQIAKVQNSTLVQYSIIGDDFKINGKQEWKESELYIWVIKPTGEVIFRKVDLKPLSRDNKIDIATLVSSIRASINGSRQAGGIIPAKRDDNTDKTSSTIRLQRLHELLITPIADLLPQNPNDRVTFIPQNDLFLVPFPALQDKNGKYLIEKHTILTSPSIQVLELTRQQKQRIGNKLIQPNNALIVGNPTMPKAPPKIGEKLQQLSPLPGAEREAKAIGKLFKTQPLIGKQATEIEVTKRLPQARLIHLATHGLFDEIQGLNSSIALTPSSANLGNKNLANQNNEKSDGLLTAGEILDLPQLNAELVVLSACDTGRGRISGDGVIGLSRSLISAGVPSVLVSLWAVPDAPTAELMTEFYQNLAKNPDKAQALRQAMLTIMKQHQNPRDWAAFTLIGEAE